MCRCLLLSCVSWSKYDCFLAGSQTLQEREGEGGEVSQDMKTLSHCLRSLPVLLAQD